MKRREFLGLLGGAAAWLHAARAQQPERMRRIGVLSAAGPDDAEMQSRTTAFVHGLEELGWTIGLNLQIDYRWSYGDADRLRELMPQNWSLSGQTQFWPRPAPRYCL